MDGRHRLGSAQSMHNHLSVVLTAPANRLLSYARVKVTLLLLATLVSAFFQKAPRLEQLPEQPAPESSKASADLPTEQPPEPDPDVDPRCDFNPPKAALVAADYANYHVERNRGDESRSPQQLIETATLADGTRLTVISDACVDSFGRNFRFRFVRAARAAKDMAFWAATASKALSDLHMSDDAGNEVSELRDFLTRAPRLRRQGNRVVQCQDRTQPDDATCDWESHGSYMLKVERRKGWIEVEVSVDYSA
jgi:hypothetical protein